MSKGNTFENDLLELVFQNADAPLIGDSTGLRGSSTAGSLYVALHTANPDEAGAQNTSEAAYTGYARVAVARSAVGWTVTANAVENAAAVTFPMATAGTAAVTYFSVGTASSSTGKILYYGQLKDPDTGEAGFTLNIAAGITPSFAAGALDITED